MSLDPNLFGVRLAALRDAAALAQVFDYTWNATYRGVLPRAAFEERPPECNEEHWRRLLFRVPENCLLVAAVDEDDDPVGLAMAGPDRFGGQDWAEIHALYVMPGYQGLGLGRRLLSEAFRMMHEAGFEAGIVWTLTAAGSRGFYERMGGRAAHQRTSLEWGQDLPQTGYVWNELGKSFGNGAPPDVVAQTKGAP